MTNQIQIVSLKEDIRWIKSLPFSHSRDSVLLRLQRLLRELKSKLDKI